MHQKIKKKDRQSIRILHVVAIPCRHHQKGHEELKYMYFLKNRLTNLIFLANCKQQYSLKPFEETD